MAGPMLPAGVVLAPGEDLLGTVGLMTSNVFVYLKLKLALTNRRLAGERPNTFIGGIPIGSQKISYPLSNIAGISISTRISPLPLLVGGLLVIISLGQLGDRWLLLAIGVLLLLYSYSAYLAITNSGGGMIYHRISVFDRSSAQEFASRVNTAIAEHVH